MRKVIYILFILFSLQIPAMAQSNPMNCLTDAEGLFLRWNKAWQRDHKDQGVIYKIERLTKVPGQKHFALELKSESIASKSSRMLSVKKSSSLPNFCKNIAVKKSTLSKKIDRKEFLQNTKDLKGNNSKARANIQSLKDGGEVKNLPFIEFKEGKWVRGDYPDGHKTSNCYVAGKNFACDETQKQKYKSQLAELERKIKIAGKIKH